MELPTIMAMVLAVFLSPALPEGIIEVGQTTCQDAKAILQKQNLRLVDTEYLTDFDSRTKLLVAEPRQSLFAVQTLSWERMGTETAVGGFTKSNRSFFQKKSQPRAGFILCGLFAETGTPDEK